MQEYTINVGDAKTFKITPQTFDNNPAVVFGKIEFDIVPTGGCLLLPNDDGSILTVQAVAPMGPQIITCKGDATPTPGETVVTTPFQVTTLPVTNVFLDHFKIEEIPNPPNPIADTGTAQAIRCPLCGKSFDTAAKYDKHRSSDH